MMKKQFLFISIASLYSHFMTSQILYHESFDNLTSGNITNDPSGATPGQGNWYVRLIPPTTAKIVPEPGKGNILAIENYSLFHGRQKNLQTKWNSRTAGNNILLIEYDFYAEDVENTHRIWLYASDYSTIIDMMLYTKYNSALQVKEAVLNASFPAQGAPTVFDQKGFNYTKSWLTIKIYVDYNTYKLYLYIPKLNILHAVPIKQVSSLGEILLLSSLNGTFSGIFNKYDNVRLTALKNVPPEVLSTNSFLSQKFNLFPNPTADVVNITNSDAMLVNQVEIYDATGKLLNTQKFSDDKEIQLNVSSLSSGTYLLHLQTTKGTAVKKLLKN